MDNVHQELPRNNLYDKQIALTNSLFVTGVC